MSVRNQSHCAKAAPASGSYAQGLRWKDLFFTTVVPYDTDCELVGDTIEEQTKQTMENLKFLLEEAGSGFGGVLQVAAYINDMDANFDGFAKVYESYFDEGDYPARSSHEATNFKHNGKQCFVELSVIAACET
jgi:2-iminobutanoate/2-iminopropanoate deaminase